MPASPPPLTVQTLMRSSLVVAGLLFLAVGLADSVAGHVKILQYEHLLRTTEPPPPADPAALFPTASEAQERYDLARAKLAFYELLLTAGQLLSALGFTLLAVGVLRLRTRSLQPLANSPPLH